MIYQTFAQLYDQLFDSSMYQQWARYTMDRLPHLTALRCLDLAGGAGRLAVLLAQRGLAVTVADLSADMLALASQHASAEQVDIHLVQADMRDLSALPTYELVTCYADSFNYLTSFEDLQTAFNQVAAHLTPDGKFLFDMISLYQTDTVYPGYMYNYAQPDGKEYFMWSSYQNDDVDHGVIHELTFFHQQADQTYHRIEETHFEQGYSLNHIRQALVKAGFSQIVVSANFGQRAVQEDSRRWFFECSK